MWPEHWQWRLFYAHRFRGHHSIITIDIVAVLFSEGPEGVVG
jgi:hypothetical protein